MPLGRALSFSRRPRARFRRRRWRRSRRRRAARWCPARRATDFTASITREISPLDAMALSGFAGSPGFGAKRNSTVFKPVRPGLVVRGERDGEIRFLESEIAQMRRSRSCASFGAAALALRGELRAGVRATPCARRRSPRRAAPALRRAIRSCAAAPRPVSPNAITSPSAAAVFALQRLEERNALLHLARARRVEIQILRVMLERLREVLELGTARRCAFGKARRRRIDALQFAQQLADFVQPQQRRIVGLRRAARAICVESSSSRRLFDGRRVARERFLLLVRLAAARPRSRCT